MVFLDSTTVLCIVFQNFDHLSRSWSLNCLTSCKSRHSKVSCSRWALVLVNFQMLIDYSKSFSRAFKLHHITRSGLYLLSLSYVDDQYGQFQNIIFSYVGGPWNPSYNLHIQIEFSDLAGLQSLSCDGHFLLHSNQTCQFCTCSSRAVQWYFFSILLTIILDTSKPGWFRRRQYNRRQLHGYIWMSWCLLCDDEQFHRDRNNWYSIRHLRNAVKTPMGITTSVLFRTPAPILQAFMP